MISGANSYFPGKKYLSHMLQVAGNLQQASNVFKTLICAVYIIQDVFCFVLFSQPSRLLWKSRHEALSQN